MASVETAGKASAVLLVDSEVTVRLALTAFLRDCGHRVIEAATSDEALVILNAVDPVDVILCSATVDGSLNGFGLATWVRRNRPELEVAIAGSAKAAADAAAQICDDGPRLGRPYEPQAVADYIRQLRAARDRRGK
ncbi:response regulator [Sandarakinorhabdus sp. DWP1-3-1]|uniref:response regulator n=1 Tax=Sandarakinorhabdus sp. DWP1-3-1 TaxID=2804627 RepID=UPI003CFBBB42